MSKLAWHFLTATPEHPHGVLRDGTCPPPDGWPIIYSGPVDICRSGLHYSDRLIDALYYAPGPIVCRDAVDDIVATHTDKGVCRERTILWRFDATRVLHEFAIWCAEQALALVDRPDPRSLRALEVKRLWLDGKATDQELSAAWAVARDVAWDATYAAARAAARAAAYAAARDASWDAARYAARDAVYAATRAAQNDELTRMVREASGHLADEEVEQ